MGSGKVGPTVNTSSQQFDYANQAYSPETQNSKKLYLCAVNDEANQVRAIGVATFQSNAPWPSQCAVVARAQNGALTKRIFGVEFGLGPSIIINPQGKQIFAWHTVDTSNGQNNLWKCGDDVPPPPHTFVCPLVTGNYPETFVSPMPIRRFCRFQRNSVWVYGWTDARYAGGLQSYVCYAMTNPTASSTQSMSIVTSTSGFQILGWSNNYLDFSQRGGPPEQQCRRFRMRDNWPNGYWPGMAGVDILEGSFNLAPNAASCAVQCRRTPGCRGVTYTNRFGWCWYVFCGGAEQHKFVH